MTPSIAVYNHPGSGESDAVIAAMIPDLQTQISDPEEGFARYWGRDATLRFVPSGSKPPSVGWTIAVLANSDVAGALGYHDLTPTGYPLGKVFAETDRQYNEVLSVTLSHELLEMLGDPWINQSAQGPDGKFYAYEACDAVEADAMGYTIGQTLVSNFVTDAWFGNGVGPYDRLKKLTRPLEIAPGGYIGVFDPGSGQGWTQVTNRLAAAESNAAREGAAKLAHGIPRVGSRRERRFRRSAGGVWLHSTYETA